jgi:hypothetical protein
VDERRLRRQEVVGDAPPEEERRDDAQAGHEQRRPADLKHLADVRLQPDLEEQDDDAQLGQRVNDGVRAELLNSSDTRERQRADEDARHQLAEHDRLAQSLEDLAADLRHDEDERETQQHERVERVPRPAALRVTAAGRGRDARARLQEQAAERDERRRRSEPRCFCHAPLHLSSGGRDVRAAGRTGRLTRRGRLP